MSPPDTDAAAAPSRQPGHPRGQPPDHPPSHQQLALLAGLGVVVVWGANFAVQKALFDLLSPAAFLFARYLLTPVAGALLLLHANA